MANPHEHKLVGRGRPTALSLATHAMRRHRNNREPARPLKGERGWIGLLCVIGAAEVAGSLETTLVFAALPKAMREVGDPVLVSWLVTGYLLVAAASSAVCGRLGDLFGRRRILLCVLAVAIVGSVVSALSDDIRLIIAGRALQGVAGAILPLGYGLIREYLPPSRVALGAGVATAAASFGGVAGFIIGGAIVDHYAWQHVFTMSAAVALAALLLSAIALPKSATTATARDVDIVGGVLFAPSAAAMLAGMSLLRGAKTLHVPALLIAAGLAGMVGWVIYELRRPNPLIDVRLLANPKVALANLACIAMGLGAYQNMMVFPLLLQQPSWTGIGFGMSATMTGVLKLPTNILAVAGAALAGPLCNRVGGETVVLIGALMTVVGWGAVWVEHDNLTFVITALSIQSAGVNVVLTAAIYVVMNAVPSQRTSEATGVTVVARIMSQAFSAQLVGLLLAAVMVTATNGGGTYPAPEAYLNTFGYIFAVCLGGTAVALLLKFWRPRPSRALQSQNQQEV